MTEWIGLIKANDSILLVSSFVVAQSMVSLAAFPY